MTKYNVAGYENIRKAPILKSIRFLQPMRMAAVKTGVVENVTLDSFKTVINAHLIKYHDYWIKRDTIADLQATLMMKTSYAEVMRYLK